MIEILQGDAVEVLGGMEPNAFDLTVTSPPYDKLRDFQGHAVDLHALGEQLFRVTKEGGAVVMVMQDQTVNGAKTLTTFKTILDWCQTIGWRLWECPIYHRRGKPGAWWQRRLRVDHDYMPVFVKGKKPAYFNKEPIMVPCKTAGKIVGKVTNRNQDGSVELIGKNFAVNPTKCPGTVWRIENASRAKSKLRHPGAFPDRLPHDFILMLCPPSGKVLDPMAGSGSTGVAAAKLGRDFVGIDISPEYCALARERIAECQPSLFGNQQADAC